MSVHRELCLVLMMVMGMVMAEYENTTSVDLELEVAAEEVGCEEAQALIEELNSLDDDNRMLRLSLMEHEGLTERLDETLESSIQSLQGIVEALREWHQVEDVNECVEGSHNCHPYATCSDTRHGFLCKCKTGYEGDGRTSCTKKCPRGAFAVDRKCFLLSDSDDQRSIDDAANACKRLGGFLAEPEDPAQLFAEISDELNDDPALLGWTDREMEDEWVGLSGRPFQHSHLWGYGEPNDAGGEHCIEVKESRLNDIDCVQEIRYLCEF